MAGATAGQALYTEFIEPVAREASSGLVVVLGLRDVAWATGSIFKATWLKVQTELEIPVAVAHLSEDVREEFHVFCMGSRRPGVEAVDWDSGGISVASLHGHVEDASLRSLDLLIQHPGSTAPELHQRSEGELQPTAWTNRLNELVRRGLAVRERAGRAWRFYPIMREVRHG